MDSRGYTRRDHRHRRRRSRNRREQMLDKLLKIFFFILIALIIIILIKVIFFKEDEGSSTNSNSSNKVSSSDKNYGNDEVSGENASDSSDLVESNSSSETSTDNQTTEPTTTEAPTTEPPTTEPPTEPYVPSGEYSILDNSAFIGDSRVGGLVLTSGFVKPRFFYDVGGNVKSAISEKSVKLDNGKYGTMIDALRQKEFEYVFIQYGVNEFGYPNDWFGEGYEALIDEIKAVQPNAKIYALAIIPVTAKYAKERNPGGQDVNSKLDEMDALLQTLAAEKGIGYINIVEGITGGERVLAPGMSRDGYHLQHTENWKVLDYICNYLK